MLIPTAAGTEADGDGIIDPIGAGEDDRQGDWACDSTLGRLDCGK